MITSSKVWIAVAALAALSSGVYVYQNIGPKELPHDISVLERIESGQPLSEADYTKLKSELESNDPAKQRDALGVGKMSKEPRVRSLVSSWAQQLIHSPDEDLRHVSLIALMKTGDPGWRAKAGYLANNDPSQFVRDGALQMLSKK